MVVHLSLAFGPVTLICTQKQKISSKVRLFLEGCNSGKQINEGKTISVDHGSARNQLDLGSWYVNIDIGTACMNQNLVSKVVMAAPRNLVVRDEENAKVVVEEEEEEYEDEDWSTGKKPKSRLPLTRWEVAAALSVFLIFSTGLFCVYLTMPPADYGKLKLPRTIADLRLLKDHLGTYAKDYPAQFILGYCSTYIFMQTFMIPGTIFMSLLAGALFGVVRGLVLVVFNASAGASSCFFLSKLIGRPLVSWLWPEKLRFFQAEIAKRKDKLLNYMLFLRITPTLPNLFINLASPIVDIPFHIFFVATLVGLVPASYITVRAGLALGDLKSVKDLYDFKTLFVLFLIGSVIIFPTLLKRKRIYE